MFVLPSVAIQFTRNIPCRHVLGSEELATTQLLFYFTKKKQHNTQQHYTLKLYHCVMALIENHFHSRFHLHFHSFSLLCVLLSFLYFLVYTLEATDGTTAHTHGPLRSDGKWFFTEKIISTFRIPSTALFSLQSPPAQNRETIKDSPAPFRWLIDELHRVHFMLLSKILISIHCVCECEGKGGECANWAIKEIYFTAINVIILSLIVCRLVTVDRWLLSYV